MISFNGKELTNIAPVKIEDIYVYPIQLNPVARQRALAWGAEFVRMGGGTRTIEISFALLEQDKEQREEYLQKIRDWASLGKEYVLALPESETKHLECAVTGLPESSYRKWWENKLKLTFTCYNNPYWTSNEPVEVPCGTTFSVGGSAPPLITIERNGRTPLTDQTYTNGKQSIVFERIPAGQLTIDLNRQTAAIGKTSIMQYYKTSSTWIVPKVGANQYINGVGTIKYRERWV